MIIKSLLDQDLYKLSMQQAVLRKYPGVCVRYQFIDRNRDRKYSFQFLNRLQNEINAMADLTLSEAETEFLSRAVPFLGKGYIAFLTNFRFNPNQVQLLLNEGDLCINIDGLWEETILWEVPLLALISEIFFSCCDTNWTTNGQLDRITAKGLKLSANGVQFTDFGTRRRRNYETQNTVVQSLTEYTPLFAGTSNVHLAMKHDVKPIGTMAHEWLMGVSALESLRYANRYALRAWNDVYRGNLGIALTDTFGTDAFFKDFDSELARLFDGVRHDSGDPFEFGQKTIKHYESLRINPETKTIVFSDSLDCDRAIALHHEFQEKINTSFGIGTHFTNDFKGSKPLNIVIKMVECNGTPVIKLSDVPTKQIGTPDALRVANWTFFEKPLDE